MNIATKYWKVFDIGFQNTFVYRVNFLIRCLFSFLPLLGTLFLWRATYAGTTGKTIAGYSLDAMVTYYLLTLLPWGALLAGRAISGLPRGLRAVLLLLAAVSGGWVTAVDICSMKLGFSEFEAFGRVAATLPGDEHRYVMDREMWASHAAILRFYDSKARPVVAEDLPVGGDGLPRWPEGELYAVAFVPPQARVPEGGWLFERQRYGLEIFGWAVAEAHPNPHYFRQGAYVAAQTGGPLEFGLRQLRRYPALALAPLKRASSAPPGRP